MIALRSVLTGALANWLEPIARLERRYFAIDGGAGAALFALLPGVDDRLRPTDSPRHADLLILAAPVSERLLPSVIDVYRNSPAPRQVVVVEDVACADHVGALASAVDGARVDGARVDGARVDGASNEAIGATPVDAAPDDGSQVAGVRVGDYLPVACRFRGNLADPATVRALAREIQGAPRTPFDVTVERPLEEVLVPLRAAAEREIATEDVVLSVGPIQHVTAGPLQLLLTTDGEQVLRAEVRSGFAARGLERAMNARSTERPWSDALALAEVIDPIAPAAGRLAYVRAFERLHRVEPANRIATLREMTLGLERAASHLAWLTRFADLLGYDALAAESRRLTAALGAERLAVGAIVPGGWDDAGAVRLPEPPTLERLAGTVRRVATRLRADRLFGLRTRGIGVLSAERAREIGASGPVLDASERGAGDARARVFARLREAIADLDAAGTGAAQALSDSGCVPVGIPPGEAAPAGAADGHVRGPRGALTLRLVSTGVGHAPEVSWSRPSRIHLALVPELVTGLTIPDALVSLASLDLSMAEADG